MNNFRKLYTQFKGFEQSIERIKGAQRMQKMCLETVHKALTADSRKMFYDHYLSWKEDKEWWVAFIRREVKRMKALISPDEA